MKKNSNFLFTTFILILIMGIFLVSCGSSNSSTSTAVGNAGASLLQDRCSVCHALDRVTSAHKTSTEWTTTVDRMVSHGAKLNSQEQQTLIDYLAANYK
jgi:hypothetical protein